MTYTYDYPRASVTVDIVVFCKFDDRWKVLLIQRANPPFAEKWALPGGFIEMEETLTQSAVRELQEETGIENVAIEQFKTYGDPGRDPRGRTVSVVFFGFTGLDNADAKGADDAKNADWFALDNLPDLAFDHNKILGDLCSHIEDTLHRHRE